MTSEERGGFGLFFGGVGWLLIVVVGVVCLGMYGCPQYTVYKQGKDGEARLREAESSRQIAVEEAKAKREAADMLAEAEIRRAKGIAEANRIVGESLKNNHEYLTYLWIDKLDHGENTFVYIPTEGGLPVLEAGRLAESARKRAAKEAEAAKEEKKK